MRKAKKVRRPSWPDGKVAYYDVDNDGIPDELPMDDPEFIRNSQRNYEKFLASIRVTQGDQENPENRPFITQEDSLAVDWEEVN